MTSKCLETEDSSRRDSSPSHSTTRPTITAPRRPLPRLSARMYFSMADGFYGNKSGWRQGRGLTERCQTGNLMRSSYRS
ncbi:Hypothetical predicted protein [Xyrichtys novacula]|uniref:Uncharacterized protein n=1 Tax=Xyrichtys novacula TaxID=13765 RepID=A0AAV1F4G6_XYRNO|nr:Hypothetical predicted protein [Xyrichtys novacula]